MNFFTFLNTAYVTFRDISDQKKYLRETVRPLLDSLENQYNGHFSKGQKHKILNHYGLLVPVIICINFSRLYGQPYTESNRKSATMTGVATPIFDDLFDEDRSAIDMIKKLSLEPDSVIPKSFLEKVSQHISSYLLNTAVDKKSYTESVENLLNLQIESLYQVETKMTIAEVERVTYEKSVYSIVFYHTHMLGKVSDEFYEVLYQLGGLHQFCDDLLDIHQDKQQNVVTVPNSCKDFKAFRIEFIERVRLHNKKIMALPYRKKSKEHFCIIMAVLYAIALATIDNIIKIERELGNGFDWNLVDKKRYIFDHTNPKNVVRWFFNIRKLAMLS